MSRTWTKRFLLIPALTFLFIAAGLVTIWAQLDRVADRMLALRTRTTTEQVAFRLESFMAARLHLVQQMVNQWLARQINTPERFAELARATEEEFSSFQAINWIDRDGVIRWLVPEEPNLPAKDRPLSGHPGLQEILAEAAAENQPRSSGPLVLFQGGRGFGTYFPIVRNGQLEGYINGVFRMEPVILDCLQKGVLGDFHLQVLDAGEGLFRDSPPQVFLESSFSHSHPVRVLDRQWMLTLAPTPETVALYKTQADEAFLAVGLLLASGFAVMLKSFLQRQAVLSESEQRLRLAVENMPAMVAAFDAAGRCIVWNRHCERVTGYSTREVVDNPQAEGLLQPRRVGAADGDTTRFGSVEGQDQEWLLTCKDGTVRTISWSDASAGLRVPGWSAWGVGTDITERRRTEDALRLTQFAMDHAAIATFWIREDASFFYVNEAARRSLGYSREELLGMGVFDVDAEYHPESWSVHWEMINRTGKNLTFESRHRRKNGSTFPVEVTASLLNYKGQTYQFAFARDITERKRAEEERLSMERSLLETQKLESLGLLAGGVAHDFNNLLTAVLGSASLARRGAPADSPLAGHLEHIESAAQQAAELARQLLAYSGKGKFILTTVDLRSAILETDQLLRVSIPKRVTVQAELGDVPLYVRGDPGQVRQIVMNLVINAAEAIGEDEGTVRIRTGATRLEAGPLAGSVGEASLAGGEFVFLEVSDSGPGIDARMQARIFEPFFSTKAPGRGLGLSAVMGIVRGHRGAIKLDSTVGTGTIWTVYLPACEAPTDMPAVEEPRAELPTAGGTVLVVDDEDSVRTVAQVILEDSGYCVLTAQDGREGVDLFQANADEVRVVLLDMTMPRMDGRQALREIRAIRPEVRVVLSSGYDEGEASGELAGNKITSFIQKPYRADQLLRKVQEILAE
jgi:PAS domain S-box-containing protein